MSGFTKTHGFHHLFGGSRQVLINPIDQVPAKNLEQSWTQNVGHHWLEEKKRSPSQNKNKNPSVPVLALWFKLFSKKNTLRKKSMFVVQTETNIRVFNSHGTAPGPWWMVLEIGLQAFSNLRQDLTAIYKAKLQNFPGLGHRRTNLNYRNNWIEKTRYDASNSFQNIA